MQNLGIHEVPHMNQEEWAVTFKAARKKTGLTQRALADILGSNTRNIECWESGQRKPPEWVQPLLLEKLKSMAPKEPTQQVPTIDVDSLSARLDELILKVNEAKAILDAFKAAQQKTGGK